MKKKNCTIPSIYLTYVKNNNLTYTMWNFKLSQLSLTTKRVSAIGVGKRIFFVILGELIFKKSGPKIKFKNLY